MPRAPGQTTDGAGPIFLERDATGIVTLSIVSGSSSQNVIDARFLGRLREILDELDAGPPPRGVILRSGRAGSFFAGADIDRVEAVLGAESAAIEQACATGRQLYARLSIRPWPTVALIDGVCLGGGLEIALACDFRVATSAEGTALGFPEVKLGLLPGWGGTVRLSRLIGPGPAVEMIAAGETMTGAAAALSGLVDACVPESQADATARFLIERGATTGSHLERRHRFSGVVDIAAEEREFLEATTGAVIQGRTSGHYPAPPTILEAVLATSQVPAAEAGEIEGKAFATLARSPVARNLVRVFRLGERNRRDRGVAVVGDEDQRRADAASRGPEAGAFERPAVVGAGIMGAGIAAAHLRVGSAVTLVDVQPEALARSVPDILLEAAWDRGRRATDHALAVRLAGRLRTVTHTAALADADLVIESVVERTDVKRKVLAEIEAVVSPGTVIATNTSTNPISKLAESLADPTRFCGLHFFNPVRRMMLVEVVRGPATADVTVARAVAHAKRLGKCPIVVRDSPGFLVNRMLMPYLHEAVEMLRAGIDARRIDRAARAFGMPMGPLELYDMIGLDTAFYAGLVLNDAYGDRIEPSPVIPAMVKSGRLGRKTGAGFYRYAGSGPRARIERPDDGVTAVVNPYALPACAGDERSIADRLLLPMVLEATLVLDEGIVRDGSDVDLAVIHALGFPPFRGGLLAWADTIGAAEIVRRLESFADLGVRMRPTPRLEALARSGGRFTG
jgi:3-hydroxyacyl-CoA dehydrogenase/enoyl-CoA hydratase/3-hydroxybutyryl-CoA epimerase/3-hydroxyacyl-CoA dehydrogenase/enoyl-CoA hydratase/3-hydroxybutyryl-CoA epimerase/enoyl-CoA isomerase